MPNQQKLDKEVIDIPDSDDNDNNDNNNIVPDGDGMKCQVCGIRANIRHFGGIACRACGAFFRRSVALNKVYNCQCALKKFINDIVDEQFCSRVFCRACRLKKCLEIGMRPEAVRSAYLRSFHTERRATANLATTLANDGSTEDEQYEGIKTAVPNVSQLTHSELADLDSFYLNLLFPLLPLETRTLRIYSSETILAYEYYHKYKNLEDLTEYTNNILDHYNKFSEKRPAVWPRLKAIKYCEETGFWEDSNFLGPFFQNLMLCVDMVKAMPVFSKLELEDRKALLQDAVGKVFQFSMAYFSSIMCNEAIVYGNGTNLFELFFAIARHYKSNLIINAARKVFVNPMGVMNRIQPSKEEFVLLLAMLVSTPGDKSYLIQLIVLASIFIVPTLSDGANDLRDLLRCEDILDRTANGFMQHLVNIVKEAVQGAHKDWHNVGQEIDELAKYVDIFDTYSEKVLIPKPGIFPLAKEQKLWNAKITFAKALKVKVMQRETVDFCMRSLLKCKEICHNAPTNDRKYEKCHGELLAKIGHFFHTVGIEHLPVA